MIILLCTLLPLFSYSQTTVFEEDFEGALQVTPSGSPAWAINSSLQVSGSNSYTNTIAYADSSKFLTTTIDLTGYNFVVLDFQHICKIEYFDAAEIFVSVNNGATWTQLTQTEYLGTGQFGTQSNKFTANTYSTLWFPTQHTLAPTNTWWMHEQFNISALAGNQSQVMLKFKLRDGNSIPNGANGNAGWFLDDIKIIASPYELIPPVITLQAPILQDTVYSAGPYTVSASITDASGISDAFLFYRVNAGPWDSISMTNTGGSIYDGEIPGQPYNTHVDYYVKAVDASLSYNEATTIQKWFYTKKAPPVVIIGTGTMTQYYIPCYGFYDYGWSGSLYTAAEINASGMIDSVGFYVNNSVAAYSMNNQAMYLGQKNYTVYDGTMNQMPDVGQYTQVYTGNVTWTGPGWYMFPLASPFMYNGTQTLEVVWMNNDGSYTSGYPTFAATTMPQYMAKYNYADGAMPTANGNLVYDRPNLKLVFQPNDNDYDAGIVQISEPNGVVITSTPLDVKAVMKNYGILTLDTVNIEWEVNGTPQTPYYWGGILLEDVTSSPITVGTASFVQGWNTIKVWTSEPNSMPDENNLNDTLSIQVFGCDEILNGTYTINSLLPTGSGNFNTMNDAFSALYTCGVNGPVVFELYDATYNQSLVFNEIPGATSVNTVTFRPAATHDVVITSASSTATVKFNAGKYIIFDGSNNGTDSRNMTIRNTATSANTAAIWMSSIGATVAQGCSELTIKNCILEAGSNTVTSTFGVFIGGTSIFTTGTGNFNNSITLQNNSISKAFYGVYSRSATPNLNTNFVVSNNSIGSDVPASYIGFRGVDIQGATAPIITGNTIFNIQTNQSVNISGIEIGQYVGNAQITKNTVYGLKNTNLLGYGAYGIHIASTLSVDNILIANNFIFNILSAKYSATSNSANPFGIRVIGGSNIKIYNNSVHLSGESTAGTSATMSAPLIITASVSGLDVRNNIFSNSMTGDAGSKSYAIHKSSSTSFSAIDYNDYYVSGTFGVLGYSGTADVATLTGWQTTTALDVHSISEKPWFISDINLHTFSSNVNAKGVTIAAITDDIDGDPRDPSTPDIGADEFTPLADDILLVSILTPSSLCGLSNAEPVVIEVMNNGTNSISSFTGTYILNGGVPVVEVFTINIPADSIVQITFTQTADLSTIQAYTLHVTLQLAGDMNPLNDQQLKSFSHSHDFALSNYVQGFELGEPYQLWSIVDNNSDTRTWQIPYVGSSYAHSGNNSARFYNSSTNIGDDYMFSRCFTMYAGEVYEISYWYRAENASYPQKIDLKVSNDITVGSVIQTLITNSAITNTAHQEAITTFTVPSDGQYYFVWHAYSAPSAYNAYVDDINIRLLPAQEAAVTSIETAAAGCDLGMEDLTIDIFNNGSQVINGNLTANYQVNGGAIVTENITDSISVGSTMIYTFLTQIDMSVVGADQTFNIVAWVDLLNDPVLFNDSAEISVLSMHTPADPVTENDTIFYANQATLVATATAQIFWFTSPTGGTSFYSGDTLVTVPLYTNTTYYVESSNQLLETDSLETTFAAGNGCSNGNMFDVTPVSDDILITGFTINPNVTNASMPVNVYYKVGTFSGFETIAGAWTLVGNYTANAVSGVPVYFDCDDFQIPAGQTYGVYVDYGANYTNGSSAYSNADIVVQTGTGLCGSFSAINLGRMFNGRIHYMKYIPGCTSNRVPVTAIVNLYQFEAGIIEYSTTPDGCAAADEPLSITIVNYGWDNISSGLTANYTINGGAVISENVSSTILSGDTLDFTFSTPISTGLTALNEDTLLNIVVWIELTGDVFNSNDTLGFSRQYNYIPEMPIVSDMDIPYGTSATINATSLNDLLWYDDPMGSPIFNGNPFITPVLYDTAYYWVSAGVTLMQHYTFDSDLEGWTPSDPCSLGYNWVWNADGTNGTAFIVNPPTYSTAVLTSPLYNINADSTFLSFEHKWDAESCCDEHFVMYSLDGGTWQTFTPTVGLYTSVGYVDSDPFNCAMDISSQPAFMGASPYITSSGYINTSGASTLQIAFIATADVSSGVDGWYINEITIEAGGCASPMAQVTVNVTGIPAIDVGPIAMTAPVTGINLGNQNVIVEVKNYGTDPVSDIPISYVVNGGAPVTDTIFTTIQPGDTTTFQFATPVNMSAYMVYNFTIYTHLPADIFLVNDTLQQSASNNPLLYCDSYSTDPSSYGDIGNVTVSNLNNGAASPIFSNPTATGGYSNYTMTLPAVELATGATYPTSVTVIYASSSYYTYYTKIFIDYNIDGVFDPVNELVFGGATPSMSNTVITGNISVPLTATPGYSRMRVVCVETSSAASVLPCGTYLWGETEDYTVLIMPQIPQDGGVITIVAPVGIYSEGEVQPVIAEIKNYGTDPLTSVPLSYQHNANPPVTQTWTGNLAPGATTQVTMPSLTVENGSNSICIETQVIDDTNAFNDEECGTFWGLPGVIFFEDNFEDGTVFTTTGTLWEHGHPAGVVINTAFEGDSCWVTNLDGPYTANATEYLVSPTMNFTGITDGYLSLAYWMHGEANFDGGTIQYSTNGGFNWTTLGVVNDTEGYNWYESYANALPAWTLPTNGWKSAFISLAPLDNAGPAVKLRFIFRSNATVQNEGFAIDDVKIHVPSIPIDAGVIEIEEPSGPTATGSANTVTVKIKNFGTTTLSSIPLTYKLNTGMPPINGTWSGTLAPGAETSFTFPTTFIGPFNPYILCAYTTVSGDAYLFNDTICQPMTPGQAQIDGGVITIINPTDIAPMGQVVSVTVAVKNFGLQSLTNIPVQYSIDGVTQTTEIIQTTVAPDATVNYTFVTSFTSTGNDFQLCAKTAVPSDAITSNDQLCHDIGTDVAELSREGITLLQNVPNPAQDQTVVSFVLPQSGTILFEITNILGQVLYSHSGNYGPGKHDLIINTNDWATGIYHYTLTVDQTRLTRKMSIQ